MSFNDPPEIISSRQNLVHFIGELRLISDRPYQTSAQLRCPFLDLLGDGDRGGDTAHILRSAYGGIMMEEVQNLPAVPLLSQLPKELF